MRFQTVHQVKAFRRPEPQTEEETVETEVSETFILRRQGQGKIQAAPLRADLERRLSVHVEQACGPLRLDLLQDQRHGVEVVREAQVKEVQQAESQFEELHHASKRGGGEGEHVGLHWEPVHEAQAAHAHGLRLPEQEVQAEEALQHAQRRPVQLDQKEEAEG